MFELALRSRPEIIPAASFLFKEGYSKPVDGIHFKENCDGLLMDAGVATLDRVQKACGEILEGFWENVLLKGFSAPKGPLDSARGYRAYQERFCHSFTLDNSFYLESQVEKMREGERSVISIQCSTFAGLKSRIISHTL